MLFKLVFIIFFASLTSQIQFTINLEPLGQYCGYEHLRKIGINKVINTKYLFAVTPHAQHNYGVDIKTMATTENPEAKTIYSNHYRREIKISKLTPQANFYSFCVKNTGTVPMDFDMTISTGLELMDFSNTPDIGEKQLINHQLTLLQNEMSAMMSQLEAIEHAKINTEGIFKMMAVRTLGFGILGGVVLALVNIALYYEVRKTLKEHKLA